MLLNASEITLTFSTSDAAFNFTLNGKYLDGASTNSSAAMANAVSADFGTDVSALQNKVEYFDDNSKRSASRSCL